jgi:hypothetical protein
MLNDVVSVRALNNLRLHVEFSDGAEGDVDVTDLVPIKGVFTTLTDPAIFRQVSADKELGCVYWPGGADLDTATLYSAITGAALPGQSSTVPV